MADTDGVEVKLGADTGDATSGMASAANSIAASLNAIQAALDKFGSTHRGAVGKAIDNNANLSRSFLEMKASAQNGFNGIIGVIERFRGVLGTLAAAIAGGFLFTKSVEAMLSLEDAVRGLSIVFGMTAEKATLLATNLKLAGVSTETYETMGMRLSMRLRLQSDEFTRLGVTIKDAKGNFLPLDQIMQNVYSRMQDFKAGTDQDLFVMDLMGRRAKDFASDMQRIGNTTERAAQLVKELGISMDESEQNKIENYRVELHAFGVVLDHIGEEIGKEVVGSLEELARWFTANKDGISAVTTVIKVLSTAIVGLGFVINALKTLLDQSATTWEKWGQEALFSLDVVAGDYADAAVAWNRAEQLKKQESSKTWDAILDQARRASETMVNIWKGASNQAVLATQDALRLMRQQEAGSYDKPKSKDLAFTAAPKGGEDTGWMENELKAFQDQFNNKMMAQGSWQTWSETQTRDYWEEILVMDNLSAKQREEAENHYYDAQRRVQQEAFAANIAHLRAEEAEAGKDIEKKIALAQQEYDDTLQRFGKIDAKTDEAYKHLAELRNQLKEKREKAADEEAKKELELVKLQVTGEEEILKQRVALKQISVQQEVAQELVLQQRIYQAQLDGFAIREAAAQNDEDKLEAIGKERVAAEQKNQDAMTKLEMKGEQDRMQYAIQATDTIDNALTTMMDNFAMNTQKASKTWQDFVKQLTSGLTSIAAKQAGQQLFGPGTSAGSAISGLTSKIFGGGAAGGTSQAAAETANTSTLGIVNTSLLSLNASILSLNSTMAAQSLGGGLGIGGGTSSGGLGVNSIFSDVAGMTDMVGFESGTPYVPQTSLAIVHRGERIVPASQNQSYAFGGTRNNFMINGPIDSRTQSQISKMSAKAANRARLRG